MKILVTGFEPLKGYWKINSSWESVNILPDNIGGSEIIKLQVPLSFKKSSELLEKIIDEIRPDIVISVGQSGLSNGILMERIAVNLNDTDTLVPDNDGDQPIDRKIANDGPDAYMSSLPVKAMAKALKAKGIPSSISDTAGTHLCNHVMYTVRHIAETKYKWMKSGFIHVPRVMSECVVDRLIEIPPGESHFMDINVMAKALEYAIISVIKECGV